MDFFRRIGTDRHKFKVQFFLKTLKSQAKLKGDVGVTIKRGDHKASTEKRVPMESDGTCNFGNQILTFQSVTMFFDSDQKAYQEKEGQIRLTIVTKKGEKKLLGNIEFDLAKFINSGKESTIVVKQFGDKVKMVFEYEVYTKFMGEASETSKSVSKKQPNKKKESSLAKLMSVFTSDDKSQKDKELQKSVQKSKSKRKDKRSKDEQKLSVEKYTKKPIQPSSVKVDKKRKVRASSGSENEEEEPIRQQPVRSKKNLVEIGKNTMTQNESELSTPAVNKKTTSPEFYFDDPQTFKKDGKKDVQTTEQNQVQSQVVKNNKNSMKRTQYAPGISSTKYNESGSDQMKEEYDRKMKEVEQNFTAKIALLTTENSSKSDEIQSLQAKIKALQKSNRSLQQKNNTLAQEKEKAEKALKDQSKKFLSSGAMFETQRDLVPQKDPSQQEKKVQQLTREKAELLVKLQKQQQKYSKDFKRYGQELQRLQMEKQEKASQNGGQLKKAKQELANLRDQNEKIRAKYQQKNNETKQFKQRQNELKEQLAIALNNLSQTKLKIGDLLNEANDAGNQEVIGVLTQLLS